MNDDGPLHMPTARDDERKEKKDKKGKKRKAAKNEQAEAPPPGANGREPSTAVAPDEEE
jgi:hypothetical protein